MLRGCQGAGRPAGRVRGLGVRTRTRRILRSWLQDPPSTVQAAGSSCDRIPTKEGELTNKGSIAEGEPLRDKPNLCAQDPKPNPNPNPLRSGP